MYYAHVGNIGCVGVYGDRRKAIAACRETVKGCGRADDEAFILDDYGEVVWQNAKAKKEVLMDHLNIHETIRARDTVPYKMAKKLRACSKLLSEVADFLDAEAKAVTGLNGSVTHAHMQGKIVKGVG